MPSHTQRGPSVAIPSVRRPKLSHLRLHPHSIVQVGRTLSKALQSMQSSNILFIKVWNVAGALQSPNVMTVGSNSPRGVLKAALYSLPNLIRILLYPQQISNLVKYIAPSSFSINSGIRGSGAAFLMVMSFNAL
jgi:hypothetical protein